MKRDPDVVPIGKDHSTVKDAFDPLERCPFPKYRGKLWAWIAQDNPAYIEWLISGEGPGLSEDLEVILTELLEHP